MYPQHHCGGGGRHHTHCRSQGDGHIIDSTVTTTVFLFCFPLGFPSLFGKARNIDNETVKAVVEMVTFVNHADAECLKQCYGKLIMRCLFLLLLAFVFLPMLTA